MSIFSNEKSKSQLIATKFNLGDIVYLITDSSKQARIVIGIKFFIDNSYMYQLALGHMDSMHYEQELTKEKEEIIIH